MTVGKPSERGAALLAVLLLVAFIAVLAAQGMERLSGATKLASNGAALGQARAYMVAAEAIALRATRILVNASPGRTTNESGWNGRETQYPVPGGIVTATINDGGNCFNLNSVVVDRDGLFAPNLKGQQQFAALLTLLSVPDGDAQALSATLTDWIDSDSDAAAGGAEDLYYLQQEAPYRTAGSLLVDPSELRAIKGMTPEIYAKLRPWVCALPEATMSPININTLQPQQALLFAMLAPANIGVDAARQLFAQRPAAGFSSLPEFWARPVPAGMNAPTDVQSQVKLTTRWFRLTSVAELSGARIEESALIDAAPDPAKLVYRSWGDAL
ncbi:MAG: type II secretion system minor pseudopilin GspK [Parasphingorhabdus sp.]|nr:type II secretion system minor pseudopilin GspK [Parasphingorhabdus sp.]